jgi:sulfatase modifying factor 1
MAGRKMRRRKQRQTARQASGTGDHANRTSLLLLLLALAMVGGLAWWRYAARSQESAIPSTEASFQPTVENARRAPGTRPEGMVWIPGGEFSMGAAEAPGMNMVGMQATTDSRPIHRVYVDGFWMDTTEVTNAQFATFVAATGYVTIAERAPRAEDFPGAPPENLVAGAVVFSPPSHPVPLNDHLQWWSYVKHADWRHPLGPGSSLTGRERYPVVQVAYDDAVAFATWAGKRLPTEAEWEFAARGGLSGKLYPWGDEFTPRGHVMANTFQGHFPDSDAGEDGYKGLGPVAAFAANGYGLYDVAGNVWEWTSDWYRPDYYAQLASAGGVARNPHGPDSPFDPSEPTEKKRVHRGGSFLCTDQYCSRYMVGTRGKGESSTGTNHVGFRLVKTS